jgi:hypothetical protein
MNLNESGANDFTYVEIHQIKALAHELISLVRPLSKMG